MAKKPQADRLADSYNEDLDAWTRVEKLLTKKIEYTSGNAIYIGYALPGTATSAEGWAIKKLTYDANNDVTDIKWASGNIAFDKEWDERATYTYS